MDDPNRRISGETHPHPSSSPPGFRSKLSPNHSQVRLRVSMQLSNLEAALAEALGEAPERERNPLSRRFRGIDIEGGGGSSECLRKTFVFRNGLRDSTGYWINL